MLKANFSSSSFVTEKCPDRLVPGIYEFGRSILKFQDMRVSKTQVQLDVWPDRVSVTRKGKNLSCIVRSSDVIKLEVDQPIELKAGDTLYLLVSLYPIQFEADSQPFSTTPIAVALESTTYDPFNSKKRPRESSPVLPVSYVPGSISKLQIHNSDDESDSDDGVVLLSKKPKLKEVENVVPPVPTSGHWNTGLLQYLKDPSKYSDVVVTFTDHLVVIKDKFPKAKLHLLVLPRQPLQNLSSLNKAHISLLESMENLASTLATQWMAKDTSTDIAKISPPPGPLSHRVLIGFHAVPSMSQLHLHIISSDFDSPSLKTKKHWNSFNSPFFIAPSKVIQSLQVSDKVQFDKTLYEAYLEGPLKCHRCSQTLPNIPALKTHISTCSEVM